MLKNLFERRFIEEIKRFLERGKFESVEEFKSVRIFQRSEKKN